MDLTDIEKDFFRVFADGRSRHVITADIRLNELEEAGLIKIESLKPLKVTLTEAGRKVAAAL